MNLTDDFQFESYLRNFFLALGLDKAGIRKQIDLTRQTIQAKIVTALLEKNPGRERTEMAQALSVVGQKPELFSRLLVGLLNERTNAEIARKILDEELEFVESGFLQVATPDQKSKFLELTAPTI